MNVKLTELAGVLLITPSVTFADFRGTNTENWNRIEYEDYGIHNDWVLDSISTSRKHVLRGIHGDGHTTKLISCLYGEIYFVVINNAQIQINTNNGNLFIYQVQIDNKF